MTEAIQQMLLVQAYETFKKCEICLEKYAKMQTKNISWAWNSKYLTTILLGLNFWGTLAF